jgi:hypothetical protein
VYTRFSSEDDERADLQLGEIVESILDPEAANKKIGVSISANSGFIN